MKLILSVTALAVSFAATPILANPSLLVTLSASENVIQHSGGCRKSSPKGNAVTQARNLTIATEPLRASS